MSVADEQAARRCDGRPSPEVGWYGRRVHGDPSDEHGARAYGGYDIAGRGPGTAGRVVNELQDVFAAGHEKVVVAVESQGRHATNRSLLLSTASAGPAVLVITVPVME